SGGDKGEHPDLDPRPRLGTSAANAVGRSRGQTKSGDQQQPPCETVPGRSALHHVERMWKTFKSVLKREGRESENDHLYVFEFLYREQQKLKGMTTPSEMFPQFLQHIHDTYPGYGIEGLKPKDYIPQQ
ncbi:hypothetical protein ANN_19781, partial [Periplaneta americana]